jgi:hypothetical protein
MAPPPLETGAFQLRDTCSYPATAVSPVGAPGAEMAESADAVHVPNTTNPLDSRINAKTTVPTVTILSPEIKLPPLQPCDGESLIF